MHLRPWKQSDLPVMATILADGGLTDTLTNWMSHNIQKQYTSFRRADLDYLRHEWRKTGRQCIALVADADEKDKIQPIPAHAQQTPQSYKDPAHFEVDGELIVGWAWFERLGKSPQAAKWQKSQPPGYLQNLVERGILSIEGAITDWIPNYHPTVDKTKFNMMDEITKEWDEEIFAEAWEIEGMYVHPNYHRKGYAKIMLDWILDKAREENVPVIVRSSPFGGSMYQKYGFRSIADEGFSKYFDETAFGGVNHQMWVWEPEGSDGKWWERAKAKIDEKEKETDTATT